MRINGVDIPPSDNMAIVAVTYDNGEVFQHFGRTEMFKLFEIVDGKIVSERIIDNGGFGHGSLANYLKGLDVTALICGGIGSGALNMLTSQGIKVYSGATGPVDAVIAEYIDGKMCETNGCTCDHHSGVHQCSCGKH